MRVNTISLAVNNTRIVYFSVLFIPPLNLLIPTSELFRQQGAFNKSKLHIYAPQVPLRVTPVRETWVNPSAYTIAIYSGLSHSINGLMLVAKLGKVPLSLIRSSSGPHWSNRTFVYSLAQ